MPRPVPPFEARRTRFWDDFRAAVGRHRRSDVPLGVFLSGGVDSSSVAAALAELEPAAGIRTFSIGFEDPSFDESVARPGRGPASWGPTTASGRSRPTR